MTSTAVAATTTTTVTTLVLLVSRNLTKFSGSVSECTVGSVRASLVHLEKLALYCFEIVSETTLALLLRLAVSAIIIPRFIVATSSFVILPSAAATVVIHFAIVLVKVLAKLCLHIVLLLGLLRLGTTTMVHVSLTAVCLLSLRFAHINSHVHGLVIRILHAHVFWWRSHATITRAI